MNDITAQAEHQHVLCKMVEWSTLFGEDKGSPSFSPDVKLHTPQDQELGHRDRIVVLQVLTKGPGNVSRGALNPCTVAPGDMLLANHYHKGLEFNILGESVVTYNWEMCMAQLKVSESEQLLDIAPLQAYIICKRNEERAYPIFMGQRAVAAGEKRIILPGGDSMHSGVAQLNERGQTVQQPKVACEEVVQVGPGAVVDGMWSEPRCQPGDMVIYDTSVAPVQVRIQGQSFTLIHWRHVIVTVREGVPAELDAEAHGGSEMSAGPEDASTTTLQ